MARGIEARRVSRLGRAGSGDDVEEFGEKDRWRDAAAVADAAAALTQMSFRLRSRWTYTPRSGS